MVRPATGGRSYLGGGFCALGNIEVKTPQEGLPGMIDWWRQRSLFARLLALAAAATLMFALAASVGAVAALMLGGDLRWPAGEVAGSGAPTSSADGRSKTPRNKAADTETSAQQYSGARRDRTAPQGEQSTYVDEVGEIQADSVEAFLDSHEKLLRYDGLTSTDIEKMQANQAALQVLANRASELRAPREYKDQKDAFLSAIEGLHQAAQLGYALAADPTSATQAGFRDYDDHVDRAATLLEQSNEILGRDYKEIEDVRSVGTS